MAVMSPVLAVVPCGGAPAAEVRATLASLAGQVAQVHLLDDDGAAPSEGNDLPEGLARLVRGELGLAEAGYVLVVPAGVVLARGAVGRLVARTQGLVVTRVVVPGLDPDHPCALWRAAWVRGEGLDLAALALAGVELDRERLSAGDPRVRAWVPADEVGAELVTRLGPEARRWARAAGARLAVTARLARVRRRLGAVRRARALRAQRLAQGE